MMNTNNTLRCSFSTTTMILCGLFAAITAICSQISIPLGFTPVPINLATLAVMLSGAFLGAKGGALSMLVYIILGATGLPVFAGFIGGLGVIVGPTGGYIIGYILCAAFIGDLLPTSSDYSKERASKRTLRSILIFIVGTLICYTIGTAWFIISTGSTISSAFFLCVLPFIPSDIIKIFLSVIISKRSLPIR